MDTSKIDLNLLRALDVLISERNVTRAAQRLNLSQPAVSAQLNRLRDIFGDQLLIPAQRGMIPTERALELQEPLHAALQQVGIVLSEKRSFDPATAEMTFSIAASDYIQHAVLISLTQAVQREAPGIRIAWHPICGRLVEEQIERGTINVWLKPFVTAPPGLKSRIVMRERFVTIACANHPKIAARKGKLDLETFLECDHVFVSPGGGGFVGAVDTALDQLGMKRRVTISVGSFLMVPEIVERTELIATVPERLAYDCRREIEIFAAPLDVPGFDVAMLWHERTDAHPAMRWLRERIVSLQNV